MQKLTLFVLLVVAIVAVESEGFCGRGNKKRATLEKSSSSRNAANEQAAVTGTTTQQDVPSEESVTEFAKIHRKISKKDPSSFWENFERSVSNKNAAGHNAQH
uniref:SSGP-11B family protein n=1 Tax=Mayetiola destructor TaxID=39758 RepID=A0PGN9_MAYDE|nr:SSGP-11B family protein [Mayetiola destructor]